MNEVKINQGYPIAAIVPAYNEADRIGETVAALRQTFPQITVIAADDGSHDATAAVAREAGATVVRAERMVGKGGVASLAAEQLTAASELPATVLLCDGDLGASAVQLERLVAVVRAGECDLAVATFSKRVGGGFGLAVGFAHWAIKRLVGLDLGAPISGQRALSWQAFEAVTPFAPRFGMEIGMTVDAARAGLRIKEIELELAHRATGRTFRGFIHRGRQLRDFVAVYRSRRS